MLMKTLLIPLAAFAVTVTGASAFNGDMLKRAGLNDDQIAAFEEAKELRESGDKEAARDVLLAAGVDEDVIKQVREAMREHKNDIHSAIAAKDYEAFKEAIRGSAFTDMIDSEAEFDKLVEAYELMQDGDREGAKDIFDELGLPGLGIDKFGHKMMRANFMANLSDEQKEALKEAMEDKDRERVREILAEAGVDSNFEFKHRGDGHNKGMGGERGFGHLKDKEWEAETD